MGIGKSITLDEVALKELEGEGVASSEPKRLPHQCVSLPFWKWWDWTLQL